MKFELTYECIRSIHLNSDTIFLEIIEKPLSIVFGVQDIIHHGNTCTYILSMPFNIFLP